MSNFLISTIRTGVPLFVAWLVSLLLQLGIEVDETTETALVNGVSGVLALAVYALIRWLEKRRPGLGWLLGVPATPTYAKEPTDG